jgi:mRNA-degrading endonuclease RelE of RelBE toxin-antitoxin system
MLFVESPLFTGQVTLLLSDDEYLRLQLVIGANPGAAPVIRDTGGLRKIRWSVPGRGKSGGIRVIYYWLPRQDQIRMLLVYRKGIKDDLTAGERRTLRSLNENWQ